MRRTTTISLALCLIVLVAAAAGYSSRATPQRAAATQSHRGGTLKLLAKAAGGTLDPQVNYTLQYWQLFQATYDGLLAFTEGGRQRGLQRRAGPRREHPDADERRQDLVFKLRKGIKFSNGKDRHGRTTSSRRSGASSR